MTRRLYRVVLVLGLAAATVVAGWQIWRLEEIRREQTAEVEPLQRIAMRAVQAIHDARASQRAYVSPSQGLPYWKARVDQDLATLREDLQTLRAWAATLASPAGSTAAQADDSALDALTEATRLERRIAEHAEAGRLEHAADLLYADNVRVSLALEHAVGAALAAHREALATQRQQLLWREAGILALLATIGFLLALLVTASRRTEEAAAADVEDRPSPVPTRTPQGASAVPSHAGAPAIAPVRADRRELAVPVRRETAGPVMDGDGAVGRPDAEWMTAAAELCVSMARVGDANGLQPVLARLADQLDATGVIVWLEDANSRTLTPAITHGYATNTLARLSAIDRDADNATSRAFRLAEPQIVAGQGAGPGAIAVPMQTAAGCVGVVAAEVRHGREQDPATLALARIAAAQLAMLTGPAPAATEPLR
jgi:hypothetical protein